MYIHYLCKFNDGLYTPKEIDNLHGGEFFIPANKSGNFDSEYDIQYRQYYGGGEFGPILLTKFTYLFHRGQWITGDIEKFSITFHIEQQSSFYKGKIHHPDFNAKFYKLTPVGKFMLDDLLDKKGYTIVGCYLT